MLCSGVASARPVVRLHLAGTLVRQAGGRVSEKPIDGLVLKAGDLVRYTIAATNSGTSPALALVPVGQIPKATSYVPGSAHANGATPEFTLDGKSWSPRPLLITKTPRGTISRPADPALYRAVRWISRHPLAANKRVVYSYDVRVNGHSSK
ncbi:MAG TPA: hypothetical protein VIG32_08270 [Candidatus Baltobacteraceae bacterium]